MANSEEEISLSELSLFQEEVQNVLVETKMTWRFSEKIQDLIFFAVKCLEDLKLLVFYTCVYCLSILISCLISEALNY